MERQKHPQEYSALGHGTTTLTTLQYEGQNGIDLGELGGLHDEVYLHRAQGNPPGGSGLCVTAAGRSPAPRASRCPCKTEQSALCTCAPPRVASASSWGLWRQDGVRLVVMGLQRAAFWGTKRY